MKCANCGAELRVGCVYCSVCGQEAQIVSDYNLLEDDFLREVLKEEEKEKKNGEAEKPSAKQNGKKKNSKQPVKKKKKKTVMWAVLAMVILAVLVTGIILLVRYEHDNSYEYQLEQAENFQKQKEYQKAEKCLERALELDDTSLDARMMLAEVYVLQEEPDSAVRLLQEVIGIDKANQEAYQMLIQVYAGQKDYEAIHTLSQEVTSTSLLQLFEDYLAAAPEFEPAPGIYHEETAVEITGQEGCTTYYTTDGSDPKNGSEYKNPIPVEPGKEIRIRAVSVNEFGIYSEETEGRFQVELKKPEKPRVTPDGGSFYGAQTISVYIPEGCKVYYTWDGTEPTQNSTLYTGPIDMPEGNNILSLILVDKYGMSSDVLKCNYIFML